jgi:transposase-like protein
MYQWISSHKKNATSTGSAELQSLRKEMARLKMENEILKKATVYFAKQMK